MVSSQGCPRQNGGWAGRDNPTDCCAEAWTCRPSIKSARKSVDAEGYLPGCFTLKGSWTILSWLKGLKGLKSKPFSQFPPEYQLE